jgi:hypothetical protein
MRWGVGSSRVDGWMCHVRMGSHRKTGLQPGMVRGSAGWLPHGSSGGSTRQLAATPSCVCCIQGRGSARVSCVTACCWCCCTAHTVSPCGAGSTTHTGTYALPAC